MGRGPSAGNFGSRKYQSKRFNSSRRFDVVEPVTLDWIEVRAAVIDCLRCHGPMKPEAIILTLQGLGISNRSAVQRCLKWLGEDGKIVRTSNQHPWRLP